jgi:hypothetical protein
VVGRPRVALLRRAAGTGVRRIIFVRHRLKSWQGL